MEKFLEISLFIFRIVLVIYPLLIFFKNSEGLEPPSHHESTPRLWLQNA